MLHQYIRQQADALAEIRLNEYRQLQGWADYEPPQPASLKDGPLRRGGGPHEGDIKQQQEPHAQKTSKVTRQARSGIIGSLYPHLVREMAPGGGDGPPPPGRGNLPPDKPDDEEGEEEEGEDTDEETESVTSSSQGSTVKPKHYQWKGTGTSYGSGAGGHQKIQMTHTVREVIGKVNVDPEATGVRGAGLDLPVKMELRDQWDLLALEDFQEGTGYPLLWDLSPPLDWEYPLSLMPI